MPSKIAFPPGCGPPRRINVTLSAEQIAIVSVLGTGMPAKGLRFAVDQVAQDRDELRRVRDALRAYKKAHPEYDWELQQAKAELASYKKVSEQR